MVKNNTACAEVIDDGMDHLYLFIVAGLWAGFEINSEIPGLTRRSFGNK